MSRREVAGKLDAIVDFADLGEFLDIPVKRYSSGMYVRLAFAVAAHVNPEILLVDEVLAVGDVAFQKKCLGQMDAVARSGRTVLFVSHQLDALAHLCPRSLLLEQGRLVAQGDTRTIIDRYLASQEDLMALRLADRPDHQGTGRLRFTDTWVEGFQGQRLPTVVCGQAIKLVLRYQVAPGQRIRRPSISFAVYTRQGTPVTQLVSGVSTPEAFDELPPSGRFECCIPRLGLNAGCYVLHVMAELGPEDEPEDWVQAAAPLTVEQGDFFGTGKLIEPRFPLLLEHGWQLSRD
jgi:lipopolysaccharide transport system ATP-binding protein